MSQKAYLLLSDGSRYEGLSIGASGTVIAEMVFTTAMTGYMETLTDPSYYGQIVLQTFPLIGNYGVIPEDIEAPHPALRGYVVKDLCALPSNFRSQDTLNTYLKQENIVGLAGIDTRALTKRLREKGVMAAILTTNPTDLKLEKLKNLAFPEAVEAVTCSQIRKIEADGPRIVLWDFGCKENIERELIKRGAYVIRVPATTTAQEILQLKPDGLILSNGPGDPVDVTYAINALKDLIPYKIPTFGVCLGNQLLALAHGYKTYKLKYGHRGANQPVRDLESGRIYITSQNHGYAVDVNTINPEEAKMRFISSNDHVCEGIDYLKEPAFTVQYHPEACGGPRDTNYLFDRFFEMLEV